MKISFKNRQGFTLIEMLIVIGIIGILASLVIVGLGGARRSGQDAKKIADLRSVQEGLELYFLRNGSYPVGNNNTLQNAIQTVDTSVASLMSPIGDWHYWSGNGAYVIGVNLQEGIAEDTTSWPGNVDCSNVKIYCVKGDMGSTGETPP